MDSFHKLENIYQHFQDNKKIYESDPDVARYETDNTLYPHINNDIEYGLFDNVINSYYLDSQIKDDFKCNQECYTDIQETQQYQPLTPCTHAYDHITQHINNLDEHSKIHYTLWKRMHHYLQVIQPCHVIIISPMVYTIQILFQKKSQKLYHQWEFIRKVNTNTVFGDSNIQYHDFNNGDSLTFKDKHTALLQQEFQNPYWCLHDPITTENDQISSEMDVETMPHTMYFSGSNCKNQSGPIPYSRI